MSDKVSSHRQYLTRKILGATAVFASVEVMTIVCSVIRTKLIALWIGTVGVGLFGLYNSAVDMLTTLAQMGVRSSGVKEVASSPAGMRDSVIYVVRRYGLYLAIVGLLLTIVLSPLLSVITFGDAGRSWTFVVLSVVVMCNVLTMRESVVLQGVNRLGTLARASVWATVVSLALSVPVIYVYRIDSVVPVIIIYAAVTAVFYLLMRYRPPHDVVKPSAAQMREVGSGMLRLGAYLTVSGVVTGIVSYLVMSYMNYAGGEELMGYYQSGFVLSVRYAGIVFTAMGMEYFPRIASVGNSGLRRMCVMVRHQCVVTLMLITSLAVIMAAAAPWIVRLLYSSEFDPVVPIVILAAPGLLFRGVSWCMGYVIVARGDGRLFLFTELSSGAICLLLNVVCFMAWGVPGIGISFTLWYFIYGIIVWRVVHSRYGLIFAGAPARIGVLCVSAVVCVCVLSFCVGPWTATAVAAVVSFLLLRTIKRRS